MSDKLLKHLLKHSEGSPDAKFYESDLVRISSSEFRTLKSKKYLVFDQYDFEQENYFDIKGNERFVRKVKGRWIANSTEDFEISPLYLTDQDLNRYSFQILPLLEEIKAQNKLNKNISAVNQRVFFIGAKDVLKEKIGIYIGLFANEAQARNELLSLKVKTDQYHKYLVICPTCEIRSQDLLSKLLAEGITCLPFMEILQNTTIDLSKIKDKKDSRLVSSKTNEQITEETTHDYLCADKIHIPGKCPRKKSNILELNNNEIKIGDSLFVLLLQLVVGAKKNRNKGGWVAFDTHAGKHQPFSNLRTPLKGSMLKKDLNIIENDGAKSYRISTSPDNITYNRDGLLNHPTKSVKDLARKLPQETGLNGKRSKLKK